MPAPQIGLTVKGILSHSNANDTLNLITCYLSTVFKLLEIRYDKTVTTQLSNYKQGHLDYGMNFHHFRSIID